MTKARDLANAATALNAVTATEIGYVDGVTSAIQTQLNAKQAVVSGVNDTELGYLDGVTSAIQTQLDGKTAKSTLTTTGDIYYASAANTPARLAIGSTSNVLTVAGGIPSWAAPAGGGSGLTLIDEVSFSASNAVNVNDVFSATYENYKIVLVGTVSPATVSIRFRVSGTDTTSGYQYLRIYSNATTVGADEDVVGNDEFFSGTFDASNKSLYSYDFSSPYLATQTSIWGGGGAVSHNAININYGSLTDTTQYTGFSIICANGMTGKVSVYGYAKE